MLDSIISAISSVRAFIIAAAVVTVGLGAALFLLCSRFSWEGKNRKLMAFFFQMGYWDCFGLACSILKCCLMIAVIFSRGAVTYVHILLYLFLHIMYMIHQGWRKGLAINVVMGIVSSGVLFVMQMLDQYLDEVVYDRRIVVVIVLMGILLFVHTLTDFFHCCDAILSRQGSKVLGHERHERRAKQKREKAKRAE